MQATLVLCTAWGEGGGGGVATLYTAWGEGGGVATRFIPEININHLSQAGSPRQFQAATLTMRTLPGTQYILYIERQPFLSRYF